MNEYFVQELEKSEFYIDHPERYVFMRSSAFSDIYGHSMSKAAKKELGGYLEITNIANGKKIYRKYYGYNRVADQHVMLDYRTICELDLCGALEEGLLSIKKSCWLKYYLLNSDLGIKVPIWIAIFGLFATLVSLILTIIFYIFPNCC